LKFHGFSQNILTMRKVCLYSLYVREMSELPAFPMRYWDASPFSKLRPTKKVTFMEVVAWKVLSFLS